MIVRAEILHGFDAEAKSNICKQIREHIEKDHKSSLFVGMDDGNDNININLSDVAGIIENIEYDGDNVFIDIQLLGTPLGKLAQEMIKNDYKVSAATVTAYCENEYTYKTTHIVSSDMALNQDITIKQQ